VVRIAAAGQVVIDGTVSAAGAVSTNPMPASAGGSIRLDAATIGGLGVVDASGGGAAGSPQAAGGGGRIALYAGTIDDGLIDRTLAAGGDATTPDRRGAAGTIFVKRDAQALGDLILDNGGLDSTQPTELLGFPPGVLEAVGTSTVTDDEADFIHDLAGIEVFFNDDRATLWTVTGNDHHGQTLTLDTSSQALTALAGDTYEGLYRFDRVIVRGGAEAVTRSEVQSTTAPEVEAGSSWVADHQPSVTLTSPTAGATVTSGSTVTVSADVADQFGVSEVELSFGAETVTDTAAPFSASFVVPIVGATTEVPVVATFRDRSGHQVGASLTVQVVPNPDGSVPVVTLAECPRAGDLVLPGQPLDLAFTVIDNEQLESYRVLVNSVVEHEVLAVDQGSVSITYAWTPPAGSAPGTAYTVRVEGRDYANNVGSAQWQLVVPAGTALTGNQSLDATLDGLGLTLGAGTYTVTGPISLQALTLTSGARVVPPAGGAVDLSVLGELRIQCGSTLDGTALGYAGGTGTHPQGYAPAGVLGAGIEHGGSHGGGSAVWNTAQTTDPPGEVYDSVYSPHLAGGGAGRDGDGSGNGRAGGGVIDLVAGTVVLDGEIRADGGSSDDVGSGGGAGGSVRIEAGSLAGDGRITADGGFVRACSSTRGVGTGGGGRVALRVDDLSGFDLGSQVQALGAALYDCSWGIYRYARPGTLYVRDAASLYGDLTVDAGEEPDGTDRDENSIEGMVTQLPALGTGSVATFEVVDTDAWLTASSPLAARWLGAWVVLEDASGADLGGFEVLEVDATGRARLGGAGAAAGATSFRGEYRFDDLVLRHGAGLSSSDPLDVGAVRAEDASRLPASMHVRGDVTLPAGASISVGAGSTLRMDVGGTLRIAAGAVLDVTGLGYAGGTSSHPAGFAPDQVLGAGVEHGGSHGGIGEVWNPAQAGSALPGEVFDSVYQPHLGGGGAGRDGDGSGDGLAGGGVIELVAGAVELDGEVRADGASSNDAGSGGGAGGTVRIEAASLSGSGLITADGGWVRACSSTRGVGTGSGGRVSLQVDDLTAFDVAAQARAQGAPLYDCSWGVYRCAAAGTVFVQTLASSVGDLRVVRQQPSCANAPFYGNTPLPTSGAGVVGLVEADAADPADLWIEPQDPAALFDLGVTGMWLRMNGSADYRVLDQTGDRRRVLLEGAAGLVAVGDAYQGVYKFDTVTVRGGAVLEFLDTAEVTTFDVDADSQVITPQ
jgi:hypothetical protein